MLKTRRIGRGSATRGWKRQKPGYHQRTVMLKRCGRKCFLGPGKSYPICTKNTCKVNPKGVYSAFIRSRQFHCGNISRRANKMLKRIGLKNK
jgi:hypothetical protein